MGTEKKAWTTPTVRQITDPAEIDEAGRKVLGGINLFMVRVAIGPGWRLTADAWQIAKLISSGVSRAEALNLAAWIVAVTGRRDEFNRLLDAIEQT